MEDVLGRRNYVADYIPVGYSGLQSHVGQWPHRRSEASARTETFLGDLVTLETAQLTRELALFNLAIDSKLHGCDLVMLKVVDVYSDGHVQHRTSIV
jgi:hypothetical protein